MALLLADETTDKYQLSQNSRDWATKACCIVSLIFNLGQRVIGQQTRSSGWSLSLDLTNERPDYNEMDKQVTLFTELTIRLKDSVSYVLDR